MLEKLNVKYRESLFRTTKLNNSCPVKVIYGYSEDKNSLIYDDISKAENVLIYGTTGSGKSVFLHTFIKGVSMFNTTEDVRLVLVDSKIVEFSQYKNNKLLLYRIINDRSELLNRIKELIDECHKRKEIIKNIDFETIRKQNIKHFPYILLIIDEYADLENKELDKVLIELMHDGFKYGIHVFLSTQNISELGVGVDFFRSFKTIVYQNNYDEKLTRKLLGDYVKLKGNGDSIVLREGELIRTQGLYAS